MRSGKEEKLKEKGEKSTSCKLNDLRELGLIMRGLLGGLRELGTLGILED